MIANDSGLAVLIQTFEHQLGLCERSADEQRRPQLSALRETWARLVEVAFGSVAYVRVCPACRRSELQTGPRCIYCWNRFSS